MNKRQVKPYEWVKVIDKYTKESYKGQFVNCGLDGITLVMENGKEKLFEHVQYDADFLHRDWQEVNKEGVICRVESSDEFVTFEVRKTENVYDLYMILGYDGKMLLKEFTDLEETMDYAEKIIDSMKQIA